MKIWFFDMKYESSTAATLSFSCALVRWSLWSYDRRSSAMIGQNGWGQKLWIWWLDEMEGEGGGGYSLRNLSLSLISFVQHRETSTTASFCEQLERKNQLSFRFVSFCFSVLLFFLLRKRVRSQIKWKEVGRSWCLKKALIFEYEKCIFNRYYQYAISTKWNVFVISLVSLNWLTLNYLK